MRRIIAALLTLCLFFAPFPAFSFVADQEGPKPVVIASGTVAANLLRFSNATGAFFVDTTDATLAAALAAAVKHNDIVEVLDGSKRAIRFVAKSQGMGETLGGNLVLNNANFAADEPPGTSWTREAGWVISGGVAVATATSGNIYQAVSHPVGSLVKDGMTVAVTSGAIALRVDGNNSSSGVYTRYRTVTSGTSSNAGVTPSNFTGTIDDRYVQQVLTPSTSGVLAAKYPGGADGFSNVAASFDYNSATGNTWNVISSVPNGRTVYSNAITSSAMHASMVAGTAFFFHDTIDFSSFAVGPSGKYLIAMYDSAGRVAWGYGKAAGTGETETADFYAGFNFTSGWTNSATGSPVDADSFLTTGSGGIYKAQPSAVGKLFKINYARTTTVSPATGSRLANTSSPAGIIHSGNGVEKYYTNPAAGFPYLHHDSAGQSDVTVLSLITVLTPPVTGLTITSTPDGETYNWAQITTGFDANAVKSVNVWRAF